MSADNKVLFLAKLYTNTVTPKDSRLISEARQILPKAKMNFGKPVVETLVLTWKTFGLNALCPNNKYSTSELSEDELLLSLFCKETLSNIVVKDDFNDICFYAGKLFADEKPSQSTIQLAFYIFKSEGRLADNLKRWAATPILETGLRELEVLNNLGFKYRSVTTLLKCFDIECSIHIDSNDNVMYKDKSGLYFYNEEGRHHYASVEEYVRQRELT